MTVIEAVYHSGRPVKLSLTVELNGRGHIVRLSGIGARVGGGEGLSLEEAYRKALDKAACRRRPSSKAPLVDIPLMLLRQVLEKYRGAPSTHSEVMGMSPNHLICRCFGVYGPQIAALSWKNPHHQQNQQTGPKDVTKHLLAGGGCTRCSGDIQRILSVCKRTPTPVQLALKVDELKCQWLLEEGEKETEEEKEKEEEEMCEWSW